MCVSNILFNHNSYEHVQCTIHVGCRCVHNAHHALYIVQVRIYSVLCEQKNGASFKKKKTLQTNAIHSRENQIAVLLCDETQHNNFEGYICNT